MSNRELFHATMRRENGDKLLHMEQGFNIIDEELERVVKPMVRRGGYIAALDHLAFWGTAYDDYRHYSQRLQKYGKANMVTRFGNGVL